MSTCQANRALSGPSSIGIFLFNRAATEAVVTRVLIYQQGAGAGPPAVVAKFDDASINPGDLWVAAYEPVHPQTGVAPGNHWLRIWTTSLDVVPTVVFEQGGSTAQPDFIEYARLQPGDFAVFPLLVRHLPPIPPVGPGRQP